MQNKQIKKRNKKTPHRTKHKKLTTLFFLYSFFFFFSHQEELLFMMRCKIKGKANPEEMQALNWMDGLKLLCINCISGSAGPPLSSAAELQSAGGLNKGQ